MLGIIIIATHHPYYGRMAYNLACSIKAVENIAVAVVTDKTGIAHLGAHQRNIFDHIIDLPEHISSGFEPKLYAYELSPFDKTLLLDADMLWLHKRTPSELFASLAGHQYTGITEGYSIGDDETNIRQDYYYWADLKEVKEVYNLHDKKIYQWRSEVMYFERSEKVESFFKTAQQIYKNPQLNTIRKFGDKIPDELAINISAAIHDIEPHKVKWIPAYWHKLNKDLVPEPHEIFNYYLVSFGSHWSYPSVKKLYDKVASVAMRKLNRQHVFSLHSKKEFLPERIKM